MHAPIQHCLGRQVNGENRYDGNCLQRRVRHGPHARTGPHAHLFSESNCAKDPEMIHKGVCGGQSYRIGGFSGTGRFEAGKIMRLNRFF